LPLAQNQAATKYLDNLIISCISVQKLYGRSVENADIISEVFHRALANQPSGKVIKAFELWLSREVEFPTLADINGLIKRNGRPPIKESDVIAARKKDPSDRSGFDWGVIRGWEEQQSEGWDARHEEYRITAIQSENLRLRKRVKDLENQLEEARREPKEPPKPFEPTPRLSSYDKAVNTVRFMRDTGYTTKDIEEFALSAGITIEQLNNIK